MKVDLGDLNISAAVAQTEGLHEGARLIGASTSGLNKTVRRLEMQLGMHLPNRMTRSVSPTETGQRLLSRLRPALSEVEVALDIVNSFRERSADTLRLNMPMSVARLVLSAIIPSSLGAYPEIQPEVVVEKNFVDILAAGSDAGVRYDERLEQDMIAVPIGPWSQRFAAAAVPGYLNRRSHPNHSRDLLDYACLRGWSVSGAILPWELERDGGVVNVDSSDSLLVRIGGAIDLVVSAAAVGVGVVRLYEDWLRLHPTSGALGSILEAWWRSLPGPYLCYPGQ